MMALWLWHRAWGKISCRKFAKRLHGIEGRKTGHSGEVTCATTLYRQGFSDQLIKERTGHCSLEALHKYKRTGPDQKYN